MTTATTPPRPDRDRVPGPAPDDAASLLLRFSVALHKHRAYPAEHPLLRASSDALLEALTARLAVRTPLVLTIGRTQVLVDDEPADAENPVLRELAERLHRRRVGALTLTRGLAAEELEAFLRALNADPARGGGGPATLASPHVHVTALSYRALGLAGDGAADAARAERSEEALWLQLATTALATDLSDQSIDTLPLEQVAGAITARAGDRRYALDLLRALSALGREAGAPTGEGPPAAVVAPAGALAQRVRSLLGALSPDALQLLVRAVADAPDRHQLLNDMLTLVPTDAAVGLVEAAAQGADQQISHFLLRLLRKLATGGPAGAAPAPDSAAAAEVREAVRGLLEHWTLDDPNPAAHTHVLEQLARRELAPLSSAPVSPAEGRRLVQIALETDSTGDQVREAVELMLDAAQLGELLALLDSAPAAAHATAAIRAQLGQPETVRRVLLDEPVEEAAVRALLGQLGPAAADPLLDALTISESQATRHLILAQLAQLGAAAGERIAARLPGAPWYLRRNLLLLLAGSGELPPGFDPRPFATDPEPTTRLEAVRLMLTSPALREEALHAALADLDDRVVRAGLEEAEARGLPRQSLTRLMLLLGDAHRPAELRALGVGLLQQFDTPTVRRWLLERVTQRGGWFRRQRLAPRSPERLAALRVLARRFSGDAAVQRVLEQAQHSSDPDIRQAARP